MKISIPKGLFEKKSTVTPVEFLNMMAEFVARVEKLEQDHNYEKEYAYTCQEENKQLRKRIKELEGVQS